MELFEVDCVSIPCMMPSLPIPIAMKGNTWKIHLSLPPPPRSTSHRRLAAPSPHRPAWASIIYSPSVRPQQSLSIVSKSTHQLFSSSTSRSMQIYIDGCRETSWLRWAGQCWVSVENQQGMDCGGLVSVLRSSSRCFHHALYD